MLSYWLVLYCDFV